jgi:hypothetical protein
MTAASRQSRPGFGAVLALALAAASAIAPPARGCDACLEDKIAATYDWSVVTAAKRQGHAVVFAALQGRLPPGDAALARDITGRLAAIPGVDAGTVRVSLAPGAASFACDAKRHAPAALLAAMSRALRPLHLALAMVRVGAAGAPPNPPESRRRPNEPVAAPR